MRPGWFPAEERRASVQNRRALSRAERRDERAAFEARRLAVADHPDRLERFNAFQRSVVATPTEDRRVSVVTNLIPLFHWSQMRTATSPGRTRALIDYGNVFRRKSDSENYIHGNPDPFATPKWWSQVMAVRVTKSIAKSSTLPIPQVAHEPDEGS